MTIISLEFKDERRSWRLEKTRFGSFNLLVGLSGVGKTSVINALKTVRALGLSKRTRTSLEGEWALEFTSEGKTYCWRARTAATDKGLKTDGKDVLESASVRFIEESIVEDERVLVDRSQEQFVFNGQRLPKLKDSESAITLLDEEMMRPVQRALQRILFSQADNWSRSRLGFIADKGSLDEFEVATNESLELLRERVDVPVILKTYLASKNHRDAFERIRSHYMDIFPNVTDLRVDFLLEFDVEELKDTLPNSVLSELITVAIREDGCAPWIAGHNISSGMLRVFYHLAELELTPSGTVIVIDEYENSMGINCLPAVTEHLKRREDDLQFILTSHHPYVINNIPVRWWRLVQRKGGVVAIRDAADIPALQSGSRQDAFTLLISSDEYGEGIG